MAKAKTRKRVERESPDAQDLLVVELQGIHSAENQLSRVLPRLSKAAQSETLRDYLQQRLEEGERIITEIEAVFEELDTSPGRKRNVAAEGLINDAREHVQELEEGPALDAVLIGAIPKRRSTTAWLPGAPPVPWPLPWGRTPRAGLWSAP